jgi:signal transduction histidine kinase
MIGSSFKLLRYFSIMSFFAIGVVTVLLGMFYRRVALNDLKELAESRNVALTQAFANSIWPQFAPFVTSAAGRSSSELRAHPEIARLRQAVLAQMNGLEVVKIKIYDLAGLTVFSTELKQIGEEKSNNAGFLSARSGKVASELTHRDTFSAFEQTIEDRDVFSSYIPIRRGETGPMEAVFELYYDVTPFLQKVKRTQITLSIGVVFVSALLYGALFIIVRHADIIIKRQDTQRSRAEQRIQLQLQRLAALRAVNLAASSTLDLPSVLRRLLKTIDALLPYSATTVRLLNRGTGELEPVACSNLDEEEWKAHMHEVRVPGVLGKLVLENKAAIVVINAQTDPRIRDSEFFRKHGLVSYLGIPLVVKDGVLGILSFYTKEGHEFSNEEIEFLSSLAGQAAIAIHNAQLHEQTKNQAVELETANQDLKRKEEIQGLLKEISQDITGLDIDSLLKKLTEKVRELFKVDVADVRVLDGKEWYVRGLSGMDPDKVPARRPGTGQSRSGWILKNRRPLLVRDITESGEIPKGGTIEGQGIRGYLGVPLFSRGGEVIGILRALTYQPRGFTQGEVDLLQQMANGAAIALENARLLEQTKKQATELEQASKMQADFTAMIIHDLRSPIMNIMGTVDMLAEGLFGPVNEEQKKWLLKVLANGHNLVDLVSDYLDLSKVEAGCINITKEDVDLGQLIQNSIENYLPLVRDRKISILGAVHPAFPRIKADPRRLNQVLSNLLSNAVKFTGDGGQIEVGADQMNGTEIRVWVKDNGIGIGREEIGGLFEKYRQLTSGKISEHKGTGLGLVICKTIVEAHGGRIWVESEAGKGATFTVRIPVEKH